MQVAEVAFPPTLTLYFKGDVSMDIYIEQIPAYVYKITCNTTNQFYFGSRFRNQKNKINPKDDIWKKYFSSSKEIKKLINEHGKESFTIEIVLEDISYDICYWEEQKIIKENIKNPLILNKHFIDPDTRKNKFSNAGNKIDPLVRKTWKSTKKQYKFLNKNNEEIIINNLQEFCENNNLSYTSMIKVNSGTKKYHKGYRSTKNVCYISPKEKTYKFIDPQGNDIDIDDLTQFCKDNQLNRRHMVRVFKCVEKSHKGYTSFYEKDDPELLEIIENYKSKIERNYSYAKTEEEKEKISESIKGKNNPCAKKYTAISQNGEKVYLYGNIEEFCLLNHLRCPPHVHKCIKNNKPYKGWRFYKDHI